MQIAMIGLGRMGMNMTRRLLKDGHDVVVWNRSADKVQQIVAEGARGAEHLEDLNHMLAPRRTVWCMLPAGDVTRQTLKTLGGILSPDDLVVEGGNSYWRDDAANAALLAEKGIGYVDAGVSGGIWGLEIGYCTMVGGAQEHVALLTPALDSLAPEQGWKHVGPVGSGHFVKMVHNGIEYALMEAYGEGFDLMRNGPFESLDLQGIAALWNRGSVVRSWLLELLDSALSKNPDLSGLKGYVEDSGEGRWTVLETVHHGVAAPVLAQALYQRFASRQDNAFSNRVLAALRNEFGGHAVKKD
ncbi:decarboxylating 6-phosphogluconate dehydrogenase [Desulfovibrio mangrovi]|uniref:phosphogluconate dehydrogenase (NAD(+)-dependent, decarboxylating) n=1 Tax=Desulfovibrio mangrovi TaxID=2976983 RepID=UPI0022466875|nr:decarboxylating 6-phosphogluconate dehydrogenase [Desulfovibrio mangrovi]UZP66131.1 decarboxylating 6-phosphogluconate dehydrogenase [Desulfovibrio mangrovi]